MDFKQLQSFVAVVNSGSFTKAAERLRVSQPTVSTHVRMLEDELGTPLVLRTIRRVELTPRGAQVYEQAVSILALRDHMMASMRVREQDTIYLGASSVPCAYVLPRALASFRRLNPGVRFVIHQQDSQDVLDGLVEGVYDVALVGMAPSDATLGYASVCRDRLVLVTAPDERFGQTRRLGADEARELLSREELVLRSEGSGSRASVDGIVGELGLMDSDLNVIARLDDQETIKNLVSCDCGVSIISERAVCDSVARGALRAFDLPVPSAERYLYVAYRKAAPLGEGVQAFVSHLRMAEAEDGEGR